MQGDGAPSLGARAAGPQAEADEAVRAPAPGGPARSGSFPPLASTAATSRGVPAFTWMVHPIPLGNALSRP